MIANRLPRVGILGLMLELNTAVNPGVQAGQEAWVGEVIRTMAGKVEFDFPGAACNRNEIEKTVAGFNAKRLDGIMVINMMYSPGLRLMRALEDNNLPILLANIQPQPSITSEWGPRDCTTNQGIHGIQDTSNVLMRMGRKATIITQDWESEAFQSFVVDWAMTVKTVESLKHMRVAMLEKMQGMGDILGDEIAFAHKFGLEVYYDGIGQVVECMSEVTEEEIDAYMEIDKKHFKIQPEVTEESHRYAAQLQLAYEKFCTKYQYDGFSVNFNVNWEDGRLKQVPILAACNMLAKGYGYSAEGDVHALIGTLIGHLISENPHFTEMFSLDYKRDAVFFSHMGEGNWKVAREDRDIKLIDRPLVKHKLENPPTPVFSVRPGIATAFSLVAIEGRRYRMVVSVGEVLDECELPNMQQNYTLFRPETGVCQSMNSWLKNGGTHHQILLMGDQSRRIEMLCDILDIQYVRL